MEEVFGAFDEERKKKSPVGLFAKIAPRFLSRSFFQLFFLLTLCVRVCLVVVKCVPPTLSSTRSPVGDIFGGERERENCFFSWTPRRRATASRERFFLLLSVPLKRAIRNSSPRAAS